MATTVKGFPADEWYLQNVKDVDPRTIRLGQPEVTVGRAVMPSVFPSYVSRNHALFKYIAGHWSVTDLKSGNGIFVNTKKIIPSQIFELKPGDLIAFSSPNSDHCYKLCSATVGPAKCAADSQVYDQVLGSTSSVQASDYPKSHTIANNKQEPILHEEKHQDEDDNQICKKVTSRRSSGNLPKCTADQDSNVLFKTLQEKLSEIEKYALSASRPVITLSSDSEDDERKQSQSNVATAIVPAATVKVAEVDEKLIAAIDGQESSDNSSQDSDGLKINGNVRKSDKCKISLDFNQTSTFENRSATLVKYSDKENSNSVGTDAQNKGVSNGSNDIEGRLNTLFNGDLSTDSAINERQGCKKGGNLQKTKNIEIVKEFRNEHGKKPMLQSSENKEILDSSVSQSHKAESDDSADERPSKKLKLEIYSDDESSNSNRIDNVQPALNLNLEAQNGPMEVTEQKSVENGPPSINRSFAKVKVVPIDDDRSDFSEMGPPNVSISDKRSSKLNAPNKVPKSDEGSNQETTFESSSSLKPKELTDLEGLEESPSSPNDETDFFPVLSQAFWETSDSDTLPEVNVGSSHDAVPSTSLQNNAINIKTENEAEPWLSTKSAQKKKVQIISPLPLVKNTRRRKSDSKVVPLKLNSESDKDVSRKKEFKPGEGVKDNSMKKKKGPSLQQKLQAKFNYRIPIAGSGSHRRKSADDYDSVRIMGQVAKSETNDIEPPNQSLYKIPKKNSSGGATVKRLPTSSASRSSFLAEEMEIKPKKKVPKQLKFPHIESPKQEDNEGKSSPSHQRSPQISGHHQSHKKSFEFNRCHNLPDLEQPLDLSVNLMIKNFIYLIISADTDSLKDGGNGDLSYGIEAKSHTKLCYTTLNEYISVYMPLLAMDVIAEACQTWSTNLMEQLITVSVKSYNIQADDSCFLYCDALMNTSKVKKSHTQSGYLVLLSLPVERRPVDSAAKYQTVFGFTRKVNVTQLKPDDGVLEHPLLNDCKLSAKDNQYTTISFEIICKLHVKSIDKSALVKLQLIDDIRPSLRKFQALLNLPKYSIVQDLLRPQISTFETDSSTQPLMKNDLNSVQAKAVSKCIHAIRHAQSVPKIVLIQGPPGTGKSFLIIRLIEQILFCAQDSRSATRILLAAQTNCAIDELVRRLVILKRKYKAENSGRIKFVRIGNSFRMNNNAKEFSLEKLTHDNIEKRKRDLELLNQQNPVKIVWDEDKERRRMREQILKCADIIATTLGGCYHPILDSLSSTSSTNFFSALIVDEACQCTELEMLVPLMYKVNKIILVGDPKQLPATVLSKRAANLNYNRSFFQRANDFFMSTIQRTPVFMLMLQYRMHPDICTFPGQMFYQNKLRTDTVMAEARDHLILKPYVVLDVKDSTEIVKNGHISNSAEASVVVQICCEVISRLPFSKKVGIITPYRQQQHDIQMLLKERNIVSVEVNTVDGFQGREMDVVILSCVRSQNYGGSIGFLSDQRRLNVAITRAKESLIICGNLQCLEVNPCWKALIDNARSRSLKFTTDCNISSEMLLK